MTPPTLQELSEVLRQSAPHRASHDRIRSSRWRASSILLATDAIVLSAICTLVIALRGASSPVDLSVATYAPVVAAIIIGNALGSVWRGIYPGYGMCAIAELRSTFYTLTGVFAAVIAVSFFTRGMLPYARSILLVGWVLSIPAVTLGRMLARRIMSRQRWYGIPVVIVGEHALASRIVDTLRHNAHIGLRPHVIIEPDAHSANYGYHAGVPIIGGLENGTDLIGRYGITHGVIAIPHATSEMLADIVDRYGQQISHFTFVGEHVHPSVVWISNVQSDPLLSAEIEQRLRQPALRWKKRLFDIAATVPLFLLSLPFMAAIAIAIKLTSKGPVLFRQGRVGERGKVFDVLKFRTMVLDADKALQHILASDDDARSEWERYHKLKRDPRITRVGAWLRKYSMDELPQLWNVLRGDMTLVGSRPFLPSELASFEGKRTFLGMYHSTKPGLTGLWQVTVRSEAEFDVRSHIDLYYMRNWSLFLDIYILLRTVGVVMTGRGAY